MNVKTVRGVIITSEKNDRGNCYVTGWQGWKHAAKLKSGIHKKEGKVLPQTQFFPSFQIVDTVLDIGWPMGGGWDMSLVGQMKSLALVSCALCLQPGALGWNVWSALQYHLNGKI